MLVDQVTTRQEGFCGLAQPNTEAENTSLARTSEALAMLASAATSDKDIIQALTTANAALTEKIYELQSKLDRALTNNNNRGRTSQQPNTAANPGNSARAATRSPGTKYCWTHGLNKTHISINCTHKWEGHQDSATATNMMGSNNSCMKPMSVSRPPGPRN